MWRLVVLCGGFWWMAAAAHAAEDTVAVATLPPASVPLSAPIPEMLELEVDELQAIPVQELSRVAISDPQVADVMVVSETELLVQAKQAGKTDILLWDQQGQRTIRLTVVSLAVARDEEAELTRLIEQLGLTDVRVRQESGLYFLVGHVESEEQRDQLEQMLEAYPAARNLVLVQPLPEPPLPVEIPPQQVRLEVQVVEISHSYAEDLGVAWGDPITSFTEQSFAAGPSGTISTSEAISEFGASHAKRLGEPFRVGRLFRTGFTATVNALIERNKARLLAQPVLVTSSGKPATSFMGTDKPIVTTSTTGVSSGTVATQIEFRPVGVELTMTPVFLEAQERINMSLKARISAIDAANGITVNGVLVPAFKTREAETEVVTASGETIVIAGLLQAEDSLAVAEVPGLGRMPVVGRFFRSPAVDNSKLELVIAVTPELVLDQEMVTERRLVLEQALASAEVAASVEDPRLRYALMVQERIAKSVRYPQREKELKLDGMVKLRLHIFADGTLGRAMVVESSGISALDAEALKAAEAQTPYPGFPSQLIERDLWLEMPIIFRSS